jgi:hypothetical protein
MKRRIARALKRAARTLIKGANRLHPPAVTVHPLGGGSGDAGAVAGRTFVDGIFRAPALRVKFAKPYPLLTDDQ